jgi:hypothetical protein
MGQSNLIHVFSMLKCSRYYVSLVAFVVTLSIGGCISKYRPTFFDSIPCQADGPWALSRYWSDSRVDSIISIIDNEGSYRHMVQEWRKAEMHRKFLYVNPRGRYQLILHWGGRNSVGNYCENWVGIYYCPCCQSVMRAAGGDSDSD